jgi:hypothetical protein
MRKVRITAVRALLALGAAGTIAASVTVPAAAMAAPSAHVHVVAVSAVPNTWYHQ